MAARHDESGLKPFDRRDLEEMGAEARFVSRGTLFGPLFPVGAERR